MLGVRDRITNWRCMGSDHSWRFMLSANMHAIFVLSSTVSLSHVPNHRYNKHYRQLSLARAEYPVQHIFTDPVVQHTILQSSMENFGKERLDAGYPTPWQLPPNLRQLPQNKTEGLHTPHNIATHILVTRVMLGLSLSAFTCHVLRSSARNCVGHH